MPPQAVRFPIPDTRYTLLTFLINIFARPWPLCVTVTMLVLFLGCLLHLIDRQVESSSRTEFLWQTKLSNEEEGNETMRGINKVEVFR